MTPPPTVDVDLTAAVESAAAAFERLGLWVWSQAVTDTPPLPFWYITAIVLMAISFQKKRQIRFLYMARLVVGAFLVVVATAAYFL
ncbi:MAG: hypothetical protein AAF267_17625 [Deinococcota bacterium]